MKRLGLVALLCLAGCQGSSDPVVVHTAADTPLYYDVGVVKRDITTSSPDAQLWFNRGLAFAYGFNHEEAIISFDRALYRYDIQGSVAHARMLYKVGLLKRSDYEAIEKGLVGEGSHILTAAFGAGLTWGAQVWRL